MSNKLTQKQRILRHFMKVGPLSSAEAMFQYGIMRLPARISDLRKEGFPIKDKFRSGTNRFGETVHYKVYWIDENDCFEMEVKYGATE